MAKAAGLAAIGAVVGITAFYLDVHTTAKQNFVVWTLIVASGSFYIGSAVRLFKALTAKAAPNGVKPGLVGFLVLYIFIHYSVATASTLMAVGMMDQKDVGAFALVLLVFALINALGGAIGGLLFGYILYLELDERGWTSAAAFIVAVLAGAVEAALCYVVQFNIGSLLLPNM